jgi:hypothetical protein
MFQPTELSRQYILSPGPIPGQPEWNRTDLPEGYCLAVHPDLPICQAERGSKSVVLLGYILHSDEPSWSNRDIIEHLVDRCGSLYDVFDLTSRCGGRYAIIVQLGDRLVIFHDTGGLRQIYYHQDPTGKSWIASEPTLIAKHLGLVIDRGIQRDLNLSELFAGSPDFWFPGRVTLYPTIRRLLPNHYFDLREQQAIRYWPRKEVPQLQFSEAVKQISSLLEGLMSGAGRRSRLALGLSCGLDSRVLLAASRAVAPRIQYFTQMTSAMNEADPDILIPRQLSERLGLRHTVLRLPDQLPPSVDELLKRELMAAKSSKVINAYSIAKDLLDGRTDTVVVYGNLAEIAKRDRFRYPQVPKWLISGAFITECVRMTGSTIAFRELSGWLDTVRQLTPLNVNILDLMHWEQRVGSWAAMTFSEYDVAFETFCPYNCRQYIEYMWGVPFKHRTMPDYRLHHAITRKLWPETLDFPVLTINRETNPFRRWAVNTLYRTWAYDPMKYLYLLLYRIPKSNLRKLARAKEQPWSTRL